MDRERPDQSDRGERQREQRTRRHGFLRGALAGARPRADEDLHTTTLVLPVRIELTTSPLPRGCSTTELRQRRAGCENRPMRKRPRVRRSLPHGRIGRKREPFNGRSQRKASVACRRVVVSQPMNERGKRAEKVSQQRRLGAALRENLKRRKAQAKARASGSGAAGAAKSHDSAGIAGHKQER